MTDDRQQDPSDPVPVSPETAAAPPTPPPLPPEPHPAIAKIRARNRVEHEVRSLTHASFEELLAEFAAKGRERPPVCPRCRTRYQLNASGRYEPACPPGEHDRIAEAERARDAYIPPPRRLGHDDDFAPFRPGRT